MTTLMITHNIENALLGNRTIMLNSGKIALDLEGGNRKKINFTT